MTQVTNHRLQEFISSRRKVSSKDKERIITLGKALVEELGLEKECDTLGKWMSHYVAEKIVSAESAKGNAKSKAETDCFETILNLWSHRGVLPNGRRPFESFEPIFRALESLDPENEYPRYFPRWESESQVAARKGRKKADNVNGWIDIANGIDRAARVLVQYALMQAAIHAADEKTRTWINKAIDSVGSDEISVIIRVISARKGTSEEDSKKEELQHRIDSIKSKIEKLDTFEKTCIAIKQQLDSELKRAEAEASKLSASDNVKPKKIRQSSKTVA